MYGEIIEVTPSPGSTVWEGTLVTEDGKRFRFAGDWRPMRDIFEALAAGECPHAEVDDWQIIGEES